MALTSTERSQRQRDREAEEKAKKNARKEKRRIQQNERRAKKRQQANPLQAIMNDPNDENYVYNEPPGVETPFNLRGVMEGNEENHSFNLTPQDLEGLNDDQIALLIQRRERRSHVGDNNAARINNCMQAIAEIDKQDQQEESIVTYAIVKRR